MKMDRRALLKLQRAKAVWSSFHPESTLSVGRIRTDTFTFTSERQLGAGVQVDCDVTGFTVDDASCSLAVRMTLYDERVGTLRSTAVGADETALAFLSFDVLAASSMMNGEEMPDSPLMDSKGSVEEFARLVDDYSRRMDRIWKFVGGSSVQGLERLAIWAIRNREQAGTMWTGLGLVCAAFVYGERELAHAVLDECRSEWERRVRLEPRELVFQIYDKIRRDIERLLEAVRARAVH